MMYKYPHIEKFYKDNFSKLLDWDSPLRPSKSCPKNGAAGVAKFLSFYKKTKSLSFTESEVLTILRAESVQDGDTIFHQNLRVMRELGFLVSADNNKYVFTDDFISFVESDYSIECYIIEKLMSIASVDDLTMYYNFLICVMREAAIYGQVILYRDSASKFKEDVPEEAVRREHQQRVYEIYGFKGDEARNVPENYTPNISYFCHAVLKQLGILVKSDKKIDNMGTLILTPLGELILKKIDENLKYGKENSPVHKGIIKIDNEEIENTSNLYRPFITAIKSKPFLLLAGISGTGKSRIVRELARACWDEGSEEYEAQKPRNFEMIQVKPNWHDSSELIGYVSRIDGVRYIVGPFLRFMVKAIKDPETPYFLCLDEMNLAPVEQYFAEYLSVVESRKRQDDGTITTDPIVDYSDTEEYQSLINQLFPDDYHLRNEYLTEEGGKRLSIPQNLIVVGTVNMDETTFSFSRKVLDRAMTIEMNEVDLTGGLDSRHEKIGKLGSAELIGNAVEGVDVYSAYKGVCDTAIDYLQKINEKLEGTPFKIAYRTRNEVLLYVVNNLPYNKDEDGDELEKGLVIARALDEITNMKILSRIEGDETKVSAKFLEGIEKTIKEGLESIFDGPYGIEETDDAYKSISLAKLDEMKNRLSSGYTSFWS